MSKLSRLITSGLIVFIAGVVLFFPARVAYRWFAPPELKLSGIHGSVWQGGANEASMNGTYLHGLQWRLQPLRLATAEFAYSVSGKFTSGFVEADIAVALSGAVHARDVRLVLPLAELQAAVGIPGLQGELSAQFSEVRIVSGLPVDIQGNAQVMRLAVPFLLAEPLGDFRAEFSAAGDRVLASIEDTRALIDVAASLQLGSDGAYHLQGFVAKTESTPPALRQMLDVGLGAPDARGQYEFRIDGRL